MSKDGVDKNPWLNNFDPSWSTLEQLLFFGKVMNIKNYLVKSKSICLKLWLFLTILPNSFNPALPIFLQLQESHLKEIQRKCTDKKLD